MEQKPIDSKQYAEDYWAGACHGWWKFGCSLEGKRRGEGLAPFLTLETFDAWDKKVLDVGCGQGFLLKFLSEYGTDVTGLDYSEYAIEHSVVPGKVILGDMTKLPFENESFDLVISRENFEHLTVEQAEQAFKEMLRVSKHWIYMTIWINHDKNASDTEVLDDFEKDPTHITYVTRIFWENKFRDIIKETGATFVRRADMDKKMDWLQKGRVFIFERKFSV